MWILFSLFAAANFFYVVIAKVNSNGFVNNSRSRYALYLTTTAIIGCVFLFVLGGFRISLNLQTLVYALFNTAVTISFLIGNALIYRYAKISTVNILTSSAGMISAALVGRIVFSEPVTPKTLIKIAVMLVAVAFVYVNARRTSDEQTLDIDRTARNKGRIVAFIISLTLVVAANQGSATLIKFFGMSKSVTDETSMFFISNVIMMLVGLSMLTYELLKKNEKPRELVKMLNLRNLVCWVGATICTNTISIVGVGILAEIEIGIYTIITSAFGVIISVVASIIFREKLGIFAYLAAILACVAVII